MSNTQVSQFIALVNARLCKGSMESTLQNIWKEFRSYPVCTALVMKGERQGQVCGKAAVKGQPFCMCHTPREKKEKPVKIQLHCSECSTVIRKGQTTCKDHRVYETCTVVLVKGSRKGEVCGKKGVCPRHNGKEKEKKIEKKQDMVEEKDGLVQIKQEPVEEETLISPPYVMATAAASNNNQKKEKVIKEKVIKEKVVKEKVIKEKKTKKQQVVEETVVPIQIKQEPVEEETISSQVVMTATKEQKKEKIVKEKKQKKTNVVVPQVPPPIMILDQVTEQQVSAHIPRSPDYPPPPHIKELYQQFNKK
jgi:hypothetical protein